MTTRTVISTENNLGSLRLHQDINGLTAKEKFPAVGAVYHTLRTAV